MLLSLVGMLSVISLVNTAYYLNTNNYITEHYDIPIEYAINSSPEVASIKFTEVKQWLEKENLTEGNTCLYKTSNNPYCNLGALYHFRIETTISELDHAVKSKDRIEANTLALKLKDRFKDSEPYNFNLYLRWRTVNSFLILVDLFCLIDSLIVLLILSTIIIVEVNCRIPNY
jgi:hypothetical protein